MMENNLDISDQNVDCLITQVCHDLEKYLSRFPNKSFALKNLSKDSSLNEKTIRRLLKKENTPSNQTLCKLYYVFTHSRSREELIGRVPKLIKSRLEEFEIDQIEKQVSGQDELLKLIESEPIACEIYLLLGASNLEISNLIYSYGQYGVKVLEKLIDLGLVSRLSSKQYTLSEKQPYLNAQILKKLGLRASEAFFKDSEASLEGKNFVGLYADSLSSEGKRKWLEIDQKAFNEKVKIARDDKYKGDEPIFTFQVSDSMTIEKRTL